MFCNKICFNTYYNTLTNLPPFFYHPQPVQTKFVEKEYEVPIKTYEFEAPKTGCFNVMGSPVPCK